MFQAGLYEFFAIAFVGPALSLVFKTSAVSTFGLALVLSCIAVAWNYLFNTLFERWESGRPKRTRSVRRRLAHGTGFEGGLAVLLIPVMSLWLNISPLYAFTTNLFLLAFFFVYAVAFTWAFDRVFGLPESVAKNHEA